MALSLNKPKLINVININRRKIIQAGILLPLLWQNGLVNANIKVNDNSKLTQKLINANNLEEVWQILNFKPIDNNFHQITINHPQVQENGAKTPINITTKLTQVSQILFAVEINPNPFVINFVLNPAIIPNISFDVKVARHSFVYALIKSANKWHYAKSYLQVTLPGCAF